jgi:hypothetical protein
MRTIIFTCSDLQVIQDGQRYLVRYDAGAHQVIMREDEISESEALRIQSGNRDMTEVLFSLQNRLIAQGVDPYLSSCSNS